MLLQQGAGLGPLASACSVSVYIAWTVDLRDVNQKKTTHQSTPLVQRSERCYACDR